MNAQDARELRWGGDRIALSFLVDPGAAVSLITVADAAGGAARLEPTDRRADPHRDQPLVEVSAHGHGRFPGGYRHVDTVIGRRLRYLDHHDREVDGGRELRIRQTDADTSLVATSVFRVAEGVPAVRAWTEIECDTPLVLDFVSSLATGAVYDATGRGIDGLDLLSAASDWVAESRWERRPLRRIGLARIDRELQHHPPRSRYVIGSRGAWSTGEALPTGVLLPTDGDRDALCSAWQVEHNGPWLYELGETRSGAYLLLAGPTDQEHQWSHRLLPGEPFVSVPVSLAVGRGGADGALAALTAQRRAIRRHRPVDDTLPVVFNDYMNTLMGDPTRDKLLPLIDAAAEAGADAFCIDAGWYAEGTWWDSVGAWEPAASRFPHGIREVIDRIREHGMVAGLWLEPEVVGVRSPLARSLPDSAFFSRDGVRVAEHGRHLLDLRDPAARAHVDAVVDRLVGEYGIAFIKLDHNTMPGPGSDAHGLSAGAGLLGHSRALLDWIDDVQARHPQLLIENCSSGAMRMDYAMLSRLHLQSTSDQQDPVMYAPIAAAAPASILPEQAGHWAYPNERMDDELFTLSLVNGMLGRMYLSGYLNRMAPARRALVAEAVAAHKALLPALTRSTALWPLGLPDWEAPWVALALGADDAVHLSVWRRPGAEPEVALPFPTLRGRGLAVEPYFPAQPNGWQWRWDPDAGVLTVHTTVEAPSARVLRLREA
ncbi:glycoside hydrolase family 36 protein [Diaminobutyricimonas aerilata]|uniref:glycoside hydrolase family 36 protein n=1 Tax=Diaminobutyricimonas aerilata TaxID=1162967 RepID=UPI001475A732|nr:glycoside hydrolase family 36 protein [Diaminobutyricimonas aerilata]